LVKAIPLCLRLVAVTLFFALTSCKHDMDVAGVSPEPISSASDGIDSRADTGAPPETPAPSAPESTAAIDAHDVAATIRRVADWQLANPTDIDPRSWVIAPLYDGLIDTSLVTGDPRYLAAVIHAGRRVRFTSGSRTYHADGHAAGYAWLRIYLMDPKKDSKVLRPFKTQLDEIVAHPIREKWSFTEAPPPGRRMTDRWTWADSLFMSPPTFALMAEATGDERYLRFMDGEYRFAYDALFDKEENLIYRDARYIHERTPNGQKVFWSRGNGWMLAGLALLLESLPADYDRRSFYVDVFKRMSAAVIAAQRPDGFWYPSLKDPGQVPSPETSGTALFTFALARGVRSGLLDHATYWPVVARGWSALRTAVDSAGAVQFVQGPAGEPKAFDSTAHVPYGTGAVLMAGAEIMRALNAAETVNPALLRQEAERLAATAPDLSAVCKHPCEPES
jgi:rhamnogalacturonyl hydrolase YesR